ncbi:sugar ABC transporter substrate-binding protein [Actinoallomurus purpureus]|uniref:ABC transporter substrate-binding protein n=1 Tax=Actinoallomurus purpureus TaxID=478114 RepID=UPI002091EFB6|nr:sugar ABC transporter substrate-binding protein [Actinoallomurus purpureus]MCO6006989.1 sugar ABC transporter substrate-binding protein [Actinoallomurus purpureus]
MKLSRLIPAAVATLTLPLAAACSSNGGSGGAYTVNWWTWDEHQAAAYQQCVPAFEKANPGITVKISQYDSTDYFTKLTADFVAGNAPDAFMNSVQYFPTYANQHALEPLNPHLSANGLQQFSEGVDIWKGKDGEQYGLPMDWATSGLYYDKGAIAKAGYTDKDIQNMTWNPGNGGTFEKIAAHLTIDDHGVRGDQPGFDSKHIKVYGSGVLGAADMVGQTSWFPFAASTGWTQGNDKPWATKFNFTDQRFIQSMDWIKSMVAKGYAPAYKQFNVGGQASISDSQQLGSGKVAMTLGGSWEAAAFANLKGIKVGLAPTVLGAVGRRAFSNANGNVIWAGSKNKSGTWKWISYQESATCQTKAALYNASFFPSINSAMDALVAQQKSKGVDLSVYTTMAKDGDLVLQAPYENGSDMQAKLTPLFEAYFDGSKGDGVWATAEQTSKQVIAENQ